METKTAETIFSQFARKYKERWKNKSLAIVEDTKIEQDMLIALFDALKIPGLEIRTYTNAQSFLDDLLLDKKKTDVCIVDGELVGNESGPEAVKELRTEDSEIKIIGRTGKMQYVKEFTKNGANLSLFKGTRTPKEFISQFEQILSVFEE